MTAAPLREIEFQLVLDSFADAVIAADASNRILYANAAVERMLGWSPAELVGLPITTIMPERLREAHRQGFERFLRTHVPRLIGRAIRVAALRRDGSELEIELSLAAHMLPGGGDLFVGSMRDISDRVELERQLKVSRFMEAATRAAAALTARLDLHHVLETAVHTLVTEFDAALARIWLYEAETDTLVLQASDGLSRETVRSKRARIQVSTYPYKVAEVARSRAPFLQNGLLGDPQFDQGWVEREGLAAAAVFPLLSAGGLTGVFVSFFRSPVLPEVYEVLGTFAAMVATAINDTKLFDREQAAHRRFHDLVNGIDHGIVWEADAETLRPTFVSARAQHVLGYSPERWLSEDRFVPAHTFDPDRERVEQALAAAKGEEQSLEHRMVHAEGDVLWFHTGVRSAREPDTGRLVLRALSVDVTRLKRAQELEERRATHMALRADVSAALSEPQAELIARLERCAAAVRRRLGAASVHVWLLDGPGELLERVASAGLPLHEADGLDRVPLGALHVGRIAARGAAFSTLSLLDDAELSALDVFWTEGVVAFAGEPLAIDERRVGVIGVFGRRPFAEDTLDALRTIADLIAHGVERDRAERSLRATEARLKRLFEANLLGIMFASVDGRVLDANDALLALLGFERADLVEGRLRWDDLTPPDYQEANRRALEELDRARSFAPFEKEYLRKDGSRVPVLVGGALVDGALDGAGEQGEVVTFVLDISELKRARANLNFLLDASQSLSQSLDLEETLRRASALTVPGLADCCIIDLIGEDGTLESVAIVHGDPAVSEEIRRFRAEFPFDPSSDEGIAKALRTGFPEVVHVGADPSWYSRVARGPEHESRLRALGITSYLLVPLSAQGRRVGALCLLSMESGRVYGDADLALATDLGQRVGAAIENARLYRESQDALRARDEFMSVASHELRTPLMPLSLSVQSVKRAATRAFAREADSPELESLLHKLGVAERQVERLNALVDQLLDITRIAAGRIPLAPEELDLSELTREVVARHDGEAKRAGSTVVVRAPDRVVGSWDRLKLEQVIDNLVSNAIKYGGGQPIDVEVTAVPPDEEETVQIVVRDQGIGIAPEDLARVFGRFERAVSPRHFGGFGLGLWIVRETVDQLGGSVSVESVLNTGSTFRVILPRRGPS